MVWVIQLLQEFRDARSWYFFRRPVLWTLSVYCALLWVLRLHGVFDKAPSNPFDEWREQRVCITAVIDAQPDERPIATVLSVQTETLSVLTDSATHTQSLNAPLLVQIAAHNSLNAAPGDRIRVCGSLRAPTAAKIPGVFDYASFLANHDVSAVLYSGGNAFNNWGNTGSFRLQRYGWQLKKWIVHRFKQKLSAEQAAVLAGLVVGQRPRFHPQLRDMFLRSGTMHVLVASGSNVAFVMLMWFVLARLVRVPSRWALTSSLIAVWGYVLISGGDAPIVRAAIMGTTLVLSHAFRRWDHPFNALGLAAWIILIANPRALFDVGFQMSFVTVSGLLLISPLRWRVLMASLTAQIWLLPISVNSFHNIYIWSSLANMIVVPLAAFGLSIGCALALSPTLFGPLAHVYTCALLRTVEFFATHLGTRIWIAPFSAAMVVAYYALCCAAPFITKRRLAVAICVMASMTFVISYGCTRARNVSDDLHVTWVDTGRSTATLAESSTQRLLVLRAEPEVDQRIERVVLPFLVITRQLPVAAIISEQTDNTLMHNELRRTCSTSTNVYCASPLMWIQNGTSTVLCADVLTMRLQRWLLENMHAAPRVIAARFPPNWKWNAEFIERFKPELLVDTGLGRNVTSEKYPWPDVPVVYPQKIGWYRWPAERD